MEQQQHLIADSAEEWFKVHQINISSIVLLGMHVVEDYNASVKSAMSGPDKLKAAIALLPRILQEARLQGIITSDQEQKFDEYIVSSQGTITTMIDTFIAISKDPSIVQMEAEVKACCVGSKRAHPGQ